VTMKNLWKIGCCPTAVEFTFDVAYFVIEDNDILKGGGMLRSSLDLGK
jgi:hypothetical protein